MSDGLKKLRALLHELFQFEDADLDFGIYRILRMRREEVSRFLEKDLAKRVETAFEKYQSVERGAEEAALRETVAQLRGLQVPDSVIDSNPKVIEHRRRIALAVSREALEDDVFARPYDFFSRYYDRGDFLSRRSYRGNTYAVPYAGEEVKLHWANADQYYIKTAEKMYPVIEVDAGRMGDVIILKGVDFEKLLGASNLEASGQQTSSDDGGLSAIAQRNRAGVRNQ